MEVDAFSKDSLNAVTALNNLSCASALSTDLETISYMPVSSLSSASSESLTLPSTIM